MSTPSQAPALTGNAGRSEPSRIVVGLSGGVDSAVAALLLIRAGHAVSTLFMKNWEADDTDDYCQSRQDLLDAVAVADRLGVDIDQVNFSAAYRERVFAQFLREYAAGRTPNPDVLCNAEIKFRAFLDTALAGGAGKIATGHYARVRDRGNRFELLKGLDVTKDQSYFLCRLTQAQLSRCLFPLGELHKTEVRRIARLSGLCVHDKKDSTGICFIGEQPFRTFLARFLPAQTGEILDTQGQIIGRHQGALYYTLGQREGLRIGGRRGAAQAPWYVIAKDVQTNRLTAAQGHDHPLLMSRALTATDLSWCADTAPPLPCACAAKTRYRQADQACTITTIDRGVATVVFSDPQRAVTPGQSVVFYDEETCLGGGIIATTTRDTAG